MKLKVENWNGCPIRFVEVEKDKWMAVAKDVTDALQYKNNRKAINDHVEKQDRKLINLNSVTKRDGIIAGNPNVVVISEFGIYDLVFSSKMKQAKDFKRWVYSVIQNLRQQAGLESYQAFEMLSKQVQKQAMERLDADGNVDYIKANQITNKAVANKYGLPKAIKTREMTPEMKKDRLAIVNDVTDLMNAKKRYGLDISVSKTIYKKVGSQHG
ncbi:hypothetical protein AYI71_03270 [Limosilactobacillus oris]|nr:hypothetical protein AYI71_03270 [Limosilactobacillus oris]